jgi:predicted metal-dependent hydrolase
MDAVMTPRRTPPPNPARAPDAAPLVPIADRTQPSTRDARAGERLAEIGSRRVPYSLRTSARARHVRLVIRPTGGLEVVVPRGTAPGRIDQVLREKARWITTTLDRVAREAATAAPVPLEDGQALPYAGARIHLSVALGAPAGRFRARLHGDTLALTVADAAQETLRTALEMWYRHQAKEVFAARIALCNRDYGFQLGRVAIKEQKSRWGSCSRQGNLNFNWRLLLAPLSVLDYVVVHELCHLKELNHSPRFWRLVAHACPDYAAQRRWLRLHGRELRF